MSLRPQGEVALPTNPNAVVFSAPARDVLYGRPWADVESVAARALRRFHEASRLGATVHFSWRVSVDRKNRKTPQVQAVFVFDGPATAAHLGVLEDAMHNGAIPWSEAHVERIPPTLVFGLSIRDGTLHRLWDASSGKALIRSLEWTERGVRIVEHTADTAPDDGYLEGVVHVKARPARYEEYDPDLERMRLVFARHFAQRIVEADGQIREEELVFLDAVFPAHLARRLGVTDAAEADKWFVAACARLPVELGHHDKLAMIGLFFSACHSDGSLDAREMRVLREAGEVLGLTRHELARYLERFW